MIISSCQTSVERDVISDEYTKFPKGGLLTTRFSSLEEFKKEVKVKQQSSKIILTHTVNEGKVISTLKNGIAEPDILKARGGGFWDKLMLGIQSPYFVSYRNDVMITYILARKRHNVFGWEDVAFFDLAQRMKSNIYTEDLVKISKEDLSEKGFINTFNHITSQAFMVVLFSEKFADFIADTHERTNMPELVSGDFTKEQIEDIKNGVVDNYVDMINNKWGQQLGKHLKQKYQITSRTNWTPELLAAFLNDIQSYYSYVFRIGFRPFKESDLIVENFAKKINRAMNGDVKVH